MEKLSLFQIGIMLNGGNSTDALYANGRQQCKVFIQVIKQSSSDDGYTWQDVPLSISEISSLTILPYSNQLRPSPAEGWLCDTTSNEYDEGLFRGNTSVGLAGTAETKPTEVNTAAEEFYRYMRFNGGQVPIQSMTFMACITLNDGKQYSTHMDDGNVAFESSITINPQSPYVLRVTDLAAARQRAYTDNSNNVDVYYWTLPGGLRVLGEAFNGEGNYSGKLAYVYSIKDGSWFRLGMAIRRHVTSLTLREIDSNLPDNPIQLINNGDRLLRAARLASSSSPNPGRYDTLTYWTITDNYGCESRFVLRANLQDKGDTVELFNG